MRLGLGSACFCDAYRRVGANPPSCSQCILNNASWQLVPLALFGRLDRNQPLVTSLSHTVY